MLTPVQQTLWKEYLKQEEIVVRLLRDEAFERFITSVESTPIEQWSDWSLAICKSVIDDKKDIPVRQRLFERLLFPVLFTSYKLHEAGSARWLLGFHHLLIRCRFCMEQLGSRNSTEHELLIVAVEQDPRDKSSRDRLIKLLRSRLEFSLHELPLGILYDTEIGLDLELFQQLKVSSNEKDKELIEKCHIHFSAYYDYLHRQDEFKSYREYLDFYHIDY